MLRYSASEPTTSAFDMETTQIIALSGSHCTRQLDGDKMTLIVIVCHVRVLPRVISDFDFNLDLKV